MLICQNFLFEFSEKVGICASRLQIEMFVLERGFMKKIIGGCLALILVGLTFSFYGQKSDVRSERTFIKPSQDRRYDQVCWLKTHNAYSAERYGYVYANQYYTIDEQLERGVRGFELDTYKRCMKKVAGIGSEGCTVSMCHGVCDVSNKWIYKPWKPGNDALGFVNSGLVPIKKFLEKNSDEIITVQLENYVIFDRGAHADMLDEYIEKSGVGPLVLKPEDWDVSQGWPTLSWMIQNNKRLVIFNDKPSSEQTKKQDILNRPYASTKYTYYQWKTIVQNQWGGAKDVNKALQERVHSVNNRGTRRFLLELDWYPDGGKILGGAVSDVINKFGGMFSDEKQIPFGGNFKKLNGPDLQHFLQRAREQGLQPSGIGKNRYPNFIKVDYFHEGQPTPLSMVNEINTRANDSQLREQMFLPMH